MSDLPPPDCITARGEPTIFEFYHGPRKTMDENAELIVAALQVRDLWKYALDGATIKQMLLSGKVAASAIINTMNLFHGLYPDAYALLKEVDLHAFPKAWHEAPEVFDENYDPVTVDSLEQVLVLYEDPANEYTIDWCAKEDKDPFWYFAD